MANLRQVSYGLEVAHLTLLTGHLKCGSLVERLLTDANGIQDLIRGSDSCFTLATLCQGVVCRFTFSEDSHRQTHPSTGVPSAGRRHVPPHTFGHSMASRGSGPDVLVHKIQRQTKL